MPQEVFSLKEHIEYQEGAVVSKEILKTANGTATLFAFDEGQGLSEHTAPFNALVYILDGGALVKVDEMEYELCEGQMIEFPANKPHSLKAVKRFKMFLVMIKP